MSSVRFGQSTRDLFHVDAGAAGLAKPLAGDLQQDAVGGLLGERQAS